MSPTHRRRMQSTDPAALLKLWERSVRSTTPGGLAPHPVESFAWIGLPGSGVQPADGRSAFEDREFFAGVW
jgi:hypothetical protein